MENNYLNVVLGIKERCLTMKTVKFPITQEYLRSIGGMTVDEALDFTKEDWSSRKGNQQGISYVPQRLEFLTNLKLRNKLEIDYYLGEELGRSYFVALRGGVIHWGHTSRGKETEYEEILRLLTATQTKASSLKENDYAQDHQSINSR